MKIELDVLFKKMQKDDKKEVLEFHILSDEIPYAQELIELAGGIAGLEIDGHGQFPAEFKKIQRDSKKAVLQFEVKGDNEEKLIKIYKLAGTHIKLNLEPSQMSIDEFYEEPSDGLDYDVSEDGTVDVLENQMSIDEIASADEDDLLN